MKGERRVVSSTHTKEISHMNLPRHKTRRNILKLALFFVFLNHTHPLPWCTTTAARSNKNALGLSSFAKIKKRQDNHESELSFEDLYMAWFFVSRSPVGLEPSQADHIDAGGKLMGRRQINGQGKLSEKNYCVMMRMTEIQPTTTTGVSRTISPPSLATWQNFIVTMMCLNLLFKGWLLISACSVDFR